MLLKNILILSLLTLTLLPARAGAEQYVVFSEQCKAGSQEAQSMFRQAQNHRFGRGVSLNIEFAVSRYAEAIIHGSSRALYDLGTLSEERIRWNPNDPTYKEKALNYFQQAADEGCPEGLYKLYLWNEFDEANISHDFPHPMLLKAAEDGAMIAMYDLGNQYLRNNQPEEGERWLKKAAELGFGDAAVPYSRILIERGQIREGMEVLFAGAKTGSTEALKRLAWIYSRGRHKQMHDPAYAECLLGVADKMLPEAPPEPVPNLDEICKPPRIMIY